MNPCGQGDRAATASERPSVGDLGRARDESLRASSEAKRPARVRYRRTSPTSKPRIATEPTFEVDIGSPPQVAVGCSPTRTAHRSRAPVSDCIERKVATSVEISSQCLYVKRVPAAKSGCEMLCSG